MKPLPAWALAEAERVVDLVQDSSRGNARTLIAMEIYHAHTKGTLEGMREQARLREVAHVVAG